jgi:hypothetical protein
MRLPTATADVLSATFTLLIGLRDAVPALGPLLVAHGTRLTIDTKERKILIGVIGPDGIAAPGVVIAADPSDPETFGAVGVPEPTEGLYTTTEETKH